MFVPHQLDMVIEQYVIFLQEVQLSGELNV